MKTRSLALPVFLLLFFSACHPAFPQQTAGIPVNVTVTVEPKKGDQLPPIARNDIIVTQGHDHRQVTDWQPAIGNHAGLAIAILIDDNSSFSLGTELNEIRNFINQQGPETLIALGYMQNGTVNLLHNFSTDHAAVAKAVRIPMSYFGAEASPFLSLSELLKRWPVNQVVPRREVLMITSGIDTVYGGGYPDPYADASIKDSQCGNIQVFSIYSPAAGHLGHSFWRTNWGQNYLSEIAEDTGGESYYYMGPQAPVSFQPYLAKLSRQLTQQFLLTFLAEPGKKGETESVKISSEIHQVDFLHANKVCAPATQSGQ